MGKHELGERFEGLMGKRLLQVFMSYKSDTPSIFEVNIDTEEMLTCTCPGYVSRGVCKHTTYVHDKLDIHDGKYPFNWIKDIEPKEFNAAMKDEDAFRSFIVANAKVEVV